VLNMRRVRARGSVVCVLRGVVLRGRRECGWRVRFL